MSDEAPSSGVVHIEPHGSHPGVEIRVRRWPAIARVHITVCGTLAEHVAALALVSATRDVLEPGAQVTLDLSEIAAMDTAGVRAVRECIERAEHVEASLVLEDLSGAARRALGQAGR